MFFSAKSKASKKFMPVFEELAESMKDSGIKFVKIDSTINDGEWDTVKSYPTLRYYSTYNKIPVTYDHNENGAIESMTKWLGSHPEWRTPRFSVFSHAD